MVHSFLRNAGLSAEGEGPYGYRRLACVRLSSIEPTTIEEELLDDMAHGSTLCPYTHVPLQSGKNLHNHVIGVSMSGTQRSHHAAHITHTGEALPKEGI